MNFDLKESMEVLERTPRTVNQLLAGLSPGWLESSEGEGTWNAAEVVDHLIEGEKNNWIPRLEHILHKGETEPFPAFDRFSHLNDKEGRTLKESLILFEGMRGQNLDKLRSLIVNKKPLEKIGAHPDFGTVKVRELISTWVVHDLTHLSQITRVMAKRYREDVGSWQAYLGILKK